MKRKFSAALIAAATVFTLNAGTAHANDDACGMVLCLGGRVMGDSGGSACASYERKYFSIIRTKHGHFSPSRTASARDSALKRCGDADPGLISRIGSQFGRVRGL